MALIKFGTIITDASGRIGGVIFSRNKFGRYVREGTIPVNPNSSRQQLIRNQFSSVVDAWTVTLTEAQKNAWRNYAANVVVQNKLGESIYLTGFNHYVRSNVAILAAGGARVDDGPVILTLPATDPDFTCTISEATQLISVAFDDALEWLDEDGGHMLVSMGLPQLAGREFFGGPYRISDAIDGDSVTPPTTPTTIACPFVCAENQVVTCQARVIRADGRMSNFFRDVLTVAS